MRAKLTTTPCNRSEVIRRKEGQFPVQNDDLHPEAQIELTIRWASPAKYANPLPSPAQCVNTPGISYASIHSRFAACNLWTHSGQASQHSIRHGVSHDGVSCVVLQGVRVFLFLHGSVGLKGISRIMQFGNE